MFRKGDRVKWLGLGNRFGAADLVKDKTYEVIRQDDDNGVVIKIPGHTCGWLGLSYNNAQVVHPEEFALAFSLKVNQIINIFGVKGKIIYIDPNESAITRIKVLLENKENMWFTLDGKLPGFDEQVLEFWDV